MQAHLPEDKFDKARSMLLGWLSNRVCHLRYLQSLIGTLQFAGRVISLGRAFMQRIINHTRGFSQPKRIIFLNDDFRKDLSMWHFFSITGMVSASFFSLTQKCHQTPTCILMPLGGQVMEPFMTIGSLEANGFLPTSSVPPQRLAQPDRSRTLYDLGYPLGQ